MTALLAAESSGGKRAAIDDNVRRMKFTYFCCASIRSSALHTVGVSLRPGDASGGEIDMDRRALVLGLLGVAAASTVLASSAAEAAPLTVAKPDAADEANRLESDFRPDVDGEAKTEDAQFIYYYRPRRRRVFYYRRRRWRRRVYFRRRVYYRRRFYRRRYYW
jgi:hypothetical protein